VVKVRDGERWWERGVMVRSTWCWKWGERGIRSEVGEGLGG